MPHELNSTLTIFISKNNDRKMENNKLKLTTKSKLMNNKSHKKTKKEYNCCRYSNSISSNSAKRHCGIGTQKVMYLLFLLSCFAPALSSFYAYNNLQLINNSNLNRQFFYKLWIGIPISIFTLEPTQKEPKLETLFFLAILANFTILLLHY